MILRGPESMEESLEPKVPVTLYDDEPHGYTPSDGEFCEPLGSSVNQNDGKVEGNNG